MKIRLLSMMAVVALAVGSFAAIASAQSYGDEPETSTSATSTDAGVENEGGVAVQVQETDEAPTDEGSEEESGDNERRRRHRGGCNLEAAATAIGVDEADLREALDEGQTIAQVAEANGVDVDTVIDAMVDAKADRLAEKVESGRITQEEADEKLADIEGSVTDRVNGVDNDQVDA